MQMLLDAGLALVGVGLVAILFRRGGRKSHRTSIDVDPVSPSWLVEQRARRRVE